METQIACSSSFEALQGNGHFGCFIFFFALHFYPELSPSFLGVFIFSFLVIPRHSLTVSLQIGNEIADAVTKMNPEPVKLKFEKVSLLPLLIPSSSLPLPHTTLLLRLRSFFISNKESQVYHPSILVTKKRYVGWKFETMTEIKENRGVYEAKGIGIPFVIPSFPFLLFVFLSPLTINPLSSPSLFATLLIHGIETVRRDTCPLVQKIMRKSLQYFLSLFSPFFFSCFLNHFRRFLRSLSTPPLPYPLSPRFPLSLSFFPPSSSSYSRILFADRDLSLVKKYVQSQFAKVLGDRLPLKEYIFQKEVRLGQYELFCLLHSSLLSLCLSVSLPLPPLPLSP